MDFDPKSYEGFEWDAGNDKKSFIKHDVRCEEAQQIFFNEPFFVAEDEKHSLKEKRYHALGKTDEGKFLHVSFTLRGLYIRIISARPMHRKERNLYEKI
ncbi:MAG: BrnT family toxin [Verrucomicrobiota bacterium]